MTDQRRRIAFGGAAALLAASALVLTLLAPGSRRSGARPAGRPADTLKIPTGPAPAPTPGEQERGGRGTMQSSTPAPLTRASPRPSTAGEREAYGAPAVTPRQARAAITAARRFLAGYLAYTYGRAPASPIRAAAVRLMRELERSTPRVPASVTRARPRLITIRAEATLGEHAIRVLAVVDDDQRRYLVALELRATDGSWAVTAVGG